MAKISFDRKFAKKPFETAKAKEELSKTENLLHKLDSLYSSFDYLKISLASAERITSWSTREIKVNIGNRLSPKIVKRTVGEVTSGETVKFSDFSPISGGLFCEKVFGPLKTGYCGCGNKYEKVGFGFACPKCYVEFTESRVRRYRMGVFHLFSPAAHAWFLRGRPSYMEQVLGIPRRALEVALYYKELFQPFEFSLLTQKEKGTLYPLYLYSQTAKNYLQICADFCFFSSKLSKQRREYLEKFEMFLLSSKIKLTQQKQYLQAIIDKIINKNQGYNDPFSKRRLPVLLKRCEKLIFAIDIISKCIKNYQKNKLNYYSSDVFDLRLEQDFEQFYKYLIKQHSSFLNQFSKQNLFALLMCTIQVQNKNILAKTGQLLKENYYEALGKNIMSDYYAKKYSGKSRKRYNGEIVYSLLDDINLKEEISYLREHLVSLGQVSNDSSKIIKRLRILESFEATSVSPVSMMLKSIPILPPTLRPLQELDNGKLISADLNEIYRLIILRTRRIFTYNVLGSQSDKFSIFQSQIAKSVQEAIDCLIDNSRVTKNRQILINNRPLKALTEILEGKEGRFRQTLLGKRVDYSGRSVIVVGPELKLNQCGLPFQIAKTLFEPFLVALLLDLKVNLEKKKLAKALNENIKEPNLEIYKGISYKRFLKFLIQKNKPLIWSLLFKTSKNYTILLNRAPTLHKFGIQAFDPLIILGESIQLHPLACSGFNADFDGDQMAVHLPLYYTSQLEVKNFVKSSSNVFSPSNGEVILKPSQDIVIGAYYLTFMREKKESDFPKIFLSKNNIILALINKNIELQTPIFIRQTLSNLSFFVEKNCLVFSDHAFILWKEKVKIIKVLHSSHDLRKVYFITSYGILVGYKLNKTKYMLTECFFETTPGRILFNISLSSSQKQS
jgi:DNA-directed RNA polymerase subunit beta'